MLKNAPFLTRTLEFLVPCFSRFEAFYYGLGMKMYDWIAGRASLFPSRFLSRSESLERLPVLRADRLFGTVAYADGGFDDARYALSVVNTFTDAGGTALNYTRVTEFGKDAGGKLVSAEIEDAIGRKLLAVRARAFLNATGPFSDTIRNLATPGAPARMRPSKGVHVLLPLEGFSGREALLVPRTEDGRVIFAIPWNGRLLVGTTDDEASLHDELVVQRSEAEYLLRQLNPYLSKPFTLDQIVSGMAGLRPLVSSGDARQTKKLVRDDEVELDPASGLLSVLGGKWTTYRAMAEDAINAVQKHLSAPVTECRTRHYPLAGARDYQAKFSKTLVAKFGVSESTACHLSEKFGTNAAQVLELIAANPQLRAPVSAGFAAILAEIIYSVRHEMAQTIEDILARRIGLQLFSWRDAIQAAPVTADLLAQEFGWSAAQKQAAIDEYTGKINRFLRAMGLEEASAKELTRAGRQDS